MTDRHSWVTKVYAYRCVLAKDDDYLPMKNTRIQIPSDAVPIGRHFLPSTLDREVFAVALLSTRNNFIGWNEVSKGTLNGTLVHPREVYKPAILGNAAAILIFHNHPSGDPQPSREDHELTKRLAEAGKVLGIDLLDHVILGEGDRYYSFKEMGLL